MSSPFSRRRRAGAAWLCVFLLPVLVSCSGPRMNGEFRSYNHAYAKSLNEQLLLNLARLENGHPAYYLAIGDIQNKFKVTTSASAGSMGNFTDNTTTTEASQEPGILTLASRSVAALAGRVVGYNFNSGVAREAAPEFKFIPLNSEDVAKQVLNPISTSVFTTLYLQGYPIDQLMRVMIERIETTLPTGEEVVLINSPTRGPMESYAQFLRSCAILRDLQQRGELLFETQSQVEGEENAAAGEPPPDGVKGRRMPTFYLRGARADKLIDELGRENQFDPGAVANVVGLLREGIAIKTDITDMGGTKTRLILRSFDRATEAVASEQAPFEALMANPKFVAMVPPPEQRPILRMMWDEGRDLAPPVETVRYVGKTYQITDPVLGPLDPVARWNRDVFRLLVALASQVTVDISKFQRQVLDVRMD